MQKYLVVVNDKYLVSVEAESAGGAEHRILDMIPIEGAVFSCQAFAPAEVKTDSFASRASRCSTVSRDEMETIFHSYAKARMRVFHQKVKLERLEQTLRELEKKAELIRTEMEQETSRLSKAEEFIETLSF